MKKVSRRALFALALAFAPTHRKILTDKIPRYTARPRLADFAVPLGYAGGGADRKSVV